MAALPWEALFDPETGSYVCRKEPLVRHVPAPYTVEPLDVQGPLRILVLIASPVDLPALDVDAERARLSDALAGPVADGRIELAWLPQAKWSEVHATLMAGPWHVLHFIGHGDYSVEKDQGLIAFVGEDGRKDLVEAERFADLLHEAEPTPRLVVLNSCASGREGAADLFSGTASTLARSGIAAVAAMQFSISDDAALEFSRGFYTAIAHGRGVDAATRSGRIEILGVPNSLDWVTPVLYLRGDKTTLFNLAPRATTVPRPPGTESSEPSLASRTSGAAQPLGQPVRAPQQGGQHVSPRAPQKRWWVWASIIGVAGLLLVWAVVGPLKHLIFPDGGQPSTSPGVTVSTAPQGGAAPESAPDGTVSFSDAGSPGVSSSPRAPGR